MQLITQEYVCMHLDISSEFLTLICILVLVHIFNPYIMQCCSVDEVEGVTSSRRAILENFYFAINNDNIKALPKFITLSTYKLKI